MMRGNGGKGFCTAGSPLHEDRGDETVVCRYIPKVIGGYGPVASEMAVALYSSVIDRTIRIASPMTAEMTKLHENIYRCVKIAL